MMASLNWATREEEREGLRKRVKVMGWGGVVQLVPNISAEVKGFVDWRIFEDEGVLAKLHLEFPAREKIFTMASTGKSEFT